MKNLLIVVFVSVFLFSCKKESENEAIYEVTFNLNWNENTFPTDYPINAHFSKLIGWSHAETASYLNVGTASSEGIRLMAEGGYTTPMDEEINALIEQGEGLDLFVGNNLSSGVGEIKLEVKVTKDFPLITLATMVAPSPDWFIAAINQSMLNENDDFTEIMVIQAVVYDAGTDDGLTFTSLNKATTPKGLITKFVDAPLGNGTALNGSFGTITFKKK
jgi:hypothetical protein